MAAALVVAAGRGERLGTASPKALVEVAGRPMLEWSVDALRRVDAVEQIVVALPEEALHAAPAGTTAVVGGAVRSESVKAALAAVDPASETVIVHDAARPLVTAELFELALEELERTGADAVVAAAPVTDTVKQVDRGSLRVRQTLDRSNLWAVQTPQAFRREALQRQLQTADPELLERATDDAWLIERAGGVVVVLPAPAENLKITTAHDLHVAESLLAGRAGMSP